MDAFVKGIKQISTTNKVILVLISFIFVTGTILTLLDDSSEKISENNITQDISPTESDIDKSNTENSQELLGSEMIEYEIISQNITDRYDDATTFYILVEPLDLEDSDLKYQISLIIEEMKMRYGESFSALIFDDYTTLYETENEYENFKDLEAEKLKYETEQLVLLQKYNFILWYTRGLETSLYKEDALWFPALEQFSDDMYHNLFEFGELNIDNYK